MHRFVFEDLVEDQLADSESVRNGWEEQRLLLGYQRESYDYSVTLELISSESF